MCMCEHMCVCACVCWSGGGGGGGGCVCGMNVSQLICINLLQKTPDVILTINYDYKTRQDRCEPKVQNIETRVLCHLLTVTLQLKTKFLCVTSLSEVKGFFCSSPSVLLCCYFTGKHHHCHRMDDK